MGLLRRSSPEKWMATSAVNFLHFSDPHPAHVMIPEAFNKLIASVTMAAKTEHPRVAVFGEAVALLWAEGNVEGAIQLEKLGNDLAKTHEVDILCAYPLSLHIQKDGHAFRTVCAEHSAVYVG
jgi:hypothetical protein